MDSQVPLTKLKNDIHSALKAWHEPIADSSPLGYLQIFRQARLRGATNARQAIHDILREAIKALAITCKEGAAVLREHFLEGKDMRIVARELHIGEATAFRRQKEGLKRLAHILHARESQAGVEHRVRLEKRLESPTYTQLIGFADYRKTMLDRLSSPGPPWLISIEGLGGIGKTSLADALTRELILASPFADIAWISARQRDFHPALGLQATQLPALDLDTLVSSLLEQFHEGAPLPASPQAKMSALTQLLKELPHLVIIDNLETAIDYQALLPALRKLANPSKFLLTSRHSLQAQADAFCLNLKELSRGDTFAFLRYEAETRGISSLADAPEEQLDYIYQVVGGNPLALKLVVGQIGILSLPRVLNNLKRAQGKKIDELYIHIYWQAWQALDPIRQSVFLLMPLAQNGDLDQLIAVSKLEPVQLTEALESLITLCLVEVGGDLTDRRYRIHRLTETFLLTEVTKW
jgi:hypothetical protein